MRCSTVSILCVIVTAAAAPINVRQPSIDQDILNYALDLGSQLNVLPAAKALQPIIDSLVRDSEAESLLSDSDLEKRAVNGKRAAQLVDGAVKLPLRLGNTEVGLLERNDHVDPEVAVKTDGGVTAAEVIGSNAVSVADHVVMTILALTRNFVPAHGQIAKGTSAA